FNVETGKYVYNYIDHLGNIRLSYAKNGAGTEIIEESNYYPFGLKHEGYNVLLGNSAYKYKYNGKELQESGMYDYGWRQYMPDIGRWMQTDPLIKDHDFTFNPSEIDEDDEDEVNRTIETTLGNGGGIFNPDNLNPFSYGYNNPIKFDDPDGRCPTCIVGALVGAATEYGLQVAANYLDPEVKNKWTDNISLSSIALSAAEGALTQGGSALRKAAVKTTVMIAKNTVEINTTKGAKVETNFRNVAKNTLIDAAAGGITKKVGGLAKTAKLEKIDKLANKVNLNSNAKAKSFVQKITGLSSRKSNIISKKLDIKSVSKQLSNGVKNFSNKTVENSTNAATKNKVDKVKDITNE
ncbi:RHS repeat domain-containing protein, partial [Chryseobacterium culicis]